ncbi:MAG: SpoIID/LytB domain-containing protein, partial [Acidobacteria bacterium]|nr:SpoIID/LytB domain-containing protein [Acidobacteriota bacterium]
AAGPVREQGFADAFVVRETAPARGGAPTLALRGPLNLFRLNPAGYLVYPSSATDFLRLNGKPYRGILDISLNRGGRITIVNQLQMEEYLYGVVPAEMSPTTYPHPAALAAQAIAARTYALKNMGRFKSEGFDLTNDDRTQVYGGAAAEREPTNEAVRSTRGLVLHYQGQPIEAMYTSTCGGRTEDFSAVFDTAPVPYLRGVICAVEAAMPAGNDGGLAGSHLLTQLVVAGDGRIANREIELAALLGLTAAGPELVDGLEQPAEADEIRRWMAAAGALLRRGSPVQIPGGSTLPHAGFVRLALAATIGREAVERTISKVDADYYLANVRDGSTVPDDARTALAFVMQKGLWAGFPDHTVRPHDPVLRKDALVILVRLALFARPEILNEASLAEVSSDSARGRALNLRWGNRNRTVPLADNVRLFQKVQERSAPAENLVLIGNEKLSFHLDSEGRIDFIEAALNPTGAASDRFSPVASWQVTLTRAQTAQKLQPLAPGVGELLDLEPERIGASGRVVSFRVRGSRQSAVLNGYRVRGALGLRDTLVTIKRAAGPDGRVESFTFDGRGFGHGVGMCQVGAYGMAQAGRSYEEILKTYYQGVDLVRAY